MPSSKADRKFMEMAVEEMRESRSEHKHKQDPLVGAVLVGTDGKPMESAHRGDLRVGDHAEFTLIERYLRDKDLDGATLYVTLEPCMRRNPPKTPCAERVVSARIGRVFVGMTDPNPDICGRGVQYLLNHGVEVDFFDLDLVRQVMDANREFINYWEASERTTSALAEPFEGSSGKELEVVERASLNDLSHDELSHYLARRKIRLRVPSDKLWKVMERAGYVGRTKKRKLAPTVAGTVLFASQPAEILPQCRVAIEAKKGGRTISGDFEGPLLAFRDHLEGFFTEHMRHFIEIRELDRVQVSEYPMEAIREAAFNAVIHRDYEAGARVHITLQESEVEIRSPGGLLKPLSLSRVRAFNAPPYSRNPHIALAVQRMGWIEEKGSGLARMRDTMVTHGLRPPLFDFADGYFVVTLPGSDQAWATVRVAPGLLGKFEDRQKKMIDFVREHGKITRNDCVERFKVSAKTATRELNRLVEVGVLEKREKGPATHYILVGTLDLMIGS